MYATIIIFRIITSNNLYLHILSRICYGYNNHNTCFHGSES